MEAWELPTKMLYLGSLVNGTVVPDNDDFSAQVVQDLAKEYTHFLLLDVVGVE